ncbi:MAG TPA: tetratricopeptide repeat protein [Candidatus Limnocylindria bacterium]|nr:tetratricopeptide repeat protein [Candidatus Limnocylindria bacterium]
MDAGTAVARLEFVEQSSAELTGPSGSDARERLEAQYDDVLAALEWFVENGQPDEALRLANGLYRFWITGRHFEAGARWFDRVLDSGAGDERLRGRAFLCAGFMPFWLGDDERAGVLFGRALEIGRRLNDAALISQALGGLSRVALRTDVAKGRRLAHAAYEVSLSADDEPGISNALHLLGVGAQIAGDLLEARDWMSRRLALVRRLGNDFLIASEASNLSMVERQLGDLAAAEALAREALEVGERIGDQFTKPFAISGLAAIALERGEHERAARLLGAVEAMMEAQKMEWPPDERPHYEHMLRELPVAMGADTFDRARASGRALSPSEAVVLALSE